MSESQQVRDGVIVGMQGNLFPAREEDHHQQALQALPRLVAPQVRLNRLQKLDAVLA
jgi:hypothetical protein